MLETISMILAFAFLAAAVATFVGIIRGFIRKRWRFAIIAGSACAALFVAILIFIAATEGFDEPDNELVVAKDPARAPTSQAAVPEPTLAEPAQVVTPSPEPALTPVPTPIPTPIKMELLELLKEYDQNKVRANSRLRYQENGKIPVTVSGYVNEIEENYAVLTPSQERYSSERLYCYYADTRVALHLTKGQLVTLTGRVRGQDRHVYVFACEFEGIDLDRNPAVPVEALRRNTVQVFCTPSSIFSSGYKGTGVVLDPAEGTILTVHHVVADENECKQIEIALPGVEEPITTTVVNTLRVNRPGSAEYFT